MLVLGGLGVLAGFVMRADLMVWYSPGLGDFCGAAIMRVCADGLCLAVVLGGLGVLDFGMRCVWFL